MNPRLQTDSIHWGDGLPALPSSPADATDLSGADKSFLAITALTKTPGAARLLRTIIAFSVVMVIHVAIYSVMTRQSSPPPTEPAPPAMQAMLFEEQRITPEPIPEPRLSDIPMGPLDIPVPEVLNIDPSAVPLKVERPVDLPIAKAAADSANPAPFAGAGNSYEQASPHFDQGLRPLPAEVIAPRGSVGPAVSQLMLNVWVEPSGRVSRASVLRSSGARWLDLAAIQYARGWSLLPGTSAGRAQGMWAAFTLLIGTDACCRTLQPAQLASSALE